MHGQAVALLSLLVFSGLLRPGDRGLLALADSIRGRMGTEPPPSAGPDRPGASSLSLNSIELALIAELSLEQARGHEEVANDENRETETRRAASAAAAAWRERAQMLQSEARGRIAEPIVPDGRPLRDPGSRYAGPERRRKSRRSGPRRMRAVTVGGRERRVGIDRRERDRRRPQPAPR